MSGSIPLFIVGLPITGGVVALATVPFMTTICTDEPRFAIHANNKTAINRKINTCTEDDFFLDLPIVKGLQKR